MPGGGHVRRHGKEPATAEDKFPEGMRVLAIEDNPVCLRVLEVLLCVCQFNPTVVMDATMALRMLREGGVGQFDLVITNVHLPDMDGFKLVELIVLKMDLPVIMLSVDGDKETMLKGINHGACACLVKPVLLKELKHIWQHVIRKKLGAVNHNSSDSDGVDQRVQPVIVEGDQVGTKSIKCSEKDNNDGDDVDENKERTSVATRENKRVTWTSELHRRFIEVVKQLGIDNAVPTKILQMMNIDYLTREIVASHLQKYRFYLKRSTNSTRMSNPLGDSVERQNSSYYMNMNHQGNSSNYHKHHRGLSSSTVGFIGSNNPYKAPSILGGQGASMQSTNWTMGIVGHGCDMIRHHSLDPLGGSFAKVSHNTMLDTFPPTQSREAYATFLREKLFEASSMVPSSHTSNSFPKILNGGLSKPENQFHVQPPELITQLAAPMNGASSAFGARRDAQFPNLVGSSRNPWHKNMASSSCVDHIYGTPLAPSSQVNVPQINQLPSFSASHGQMSMFENEQQNHITGIIINNKTSGGAFSEKTTPLFNTASNTNPVEMSSDNFSQMNLMINGGSTNYPLPILQTGNSFAPPNHMVNVRSFSPELNSLQESSIVLTQIVSPGNATGIIPVQEGPSDQQALKDQPNYSNPFLEDIFTGMLNQDFIEDDAFFGGEW